MLGWEAATTCPPPPPPYPSPYASPYRTPPHGETLRRHALQGAALAAPGGAGGRGTSGVSVQSLKKFMAVLGVTSAKSSKTMRPSGLPSADTSKNTCRRSPRRRRQPRAARRRAWHGLPGRRGRPGAASALGFVVTASAAGGGGEESLDMARAHCALRSDRRDVMLCAAACEQSAFEGRTADAPRGWRRMQGTTSLSEPIRESAQTARNPLPGHHDALASGWVRRRLQGGASGRGERECAGWIAPQTAPAGSNSRAGGDCTRTGRSAQRRARRCGRRTRRGCGWSGGRRPAPGWRT
jgi:hypothetical protein